MRRDSATAADHCAGPRGCAGRRSARTRSVATPARATPFVPQSSTASTLRAGARLRAGWAPTAASSAGGQAGSAATRCRRSGAKSRAISSSRASASPGCSVARTRADAGIDSVVSAEVPGARRCVERAASAPSAITTTSRVSAALPPLASSISRSSASGSAAFRRADSRRSPTLRVVPATWMTRSGRRPPGQSKSAPSAPSVTSQCSRSGRSSAAGGALGSFCPAPASSSATAASPAGPRARQGWPSARNSTSPGGVSASSARACARPSASRVPAASRVSMLIESSTHSVTGTRACGHCGPASATRSRAASSARRRQAGSGGWRWPAAGACAAAPCQSARRDTGRARRCRPPRCSQRISGSTSRPDSHSGVSTVSNPVAPAPGVAAACAARAARCPSR